MSLIKFASRVVKVAVLLLAYASLMAAQTPASTFPLQTEGAWARFARTVHTGKKIVVTLADSAGVTGKLIGVDPQSLRIAQAGTTEVIAAARIVRIRYAGLRKRNILYGMLAGLAGGAVTTVIVDQSSAHPSSIGEAAGMGGFLLGLPIGAIAGALIPVGPPLYERPGE